VNLTHDRTADLVARLTTPHKLGRPVLAPSRRKGDFDAEAVDCPHVFRHDGRWYMMYIGFAGQGYRTGLAVSDNLLDWERVGMILDWGPAGDCDAFGAAGTWLLRDPDLYGSQELRKHDGRYWMFYGSYDQPGYEAGYGALCAATSLDLRHWDRHPVKPLLSPHDGADWERGTLYKSCVVPVGDGTFRLFYNAKNHNTGPWTEETGFAISTDLVHWQRYAGNPVLRLGAEGAWDSKFCSDPWVCRVDDLWAMFYFGFDFGHAQDGIAFSEDLVTWLKWPEPILRVGPPGSLDSRHAHKPGIVWHEGVLYHFYCAVRDTDDYRCITVATSERVG
jgi:predicted GH43/DUF377 family glycosyl hydrolase